MILSFDLRSQNKVLDQKLFKKESDIRGASRKDHHLNFRQATFWFTKSAFYPSKNTVMSDEIQTLLNQH